MRTCGLSLFQSNASAQAEVTESSDRWLQAGVVTRGTTDPASHFFAADYSLIESVDLIAVGINHLFASAAERFIRGPVNINRGSC